MCLTDREIETDLCSQENTSPQTAIHPVYLEMPRSHDKKDMEKTSRIQERPSSCYCYCGYTYNCTCIKPLVQSRGYVSVKYGSVSSWCGWGGSCWKLENRNNTQKGRKNGSAWKWLLKTPGRPQNPHPPWAWEDGWRPPALNLILLCRYIHLLLHLHKTMSSIL